MNSKALTVANPELGAKQICPNCQAKFYDLNRRPAHCPKCDTEFEAEEAIRLRRGRGRPGLPDDDHRHSRTGRQSRKRRNAHRRVG